MACQRIENRIRKGLKNRGRPYEQRKPGKSLVQRQTERSAKRSRSRTYRRLENNRRRRRYRDRTDPRLPVGPLQEWIKRKVMTGVALTAIAATAKMDEKRLRMIRDGEQQRAGSGKVRKVKHVRISVIEKIIGPYGDTLTSIYDRDLVALYDARYHDDRYGPRRTG